MNVLGKRVSRLEDNNGASAPTKLFKLIAAARGETGKEAIIRNGYAPDDSSLNFIVLVPMEKADSSAAGAMK